MVDAVGHVSGVDAVFTGIGEYRSDVEAHLAVGVENEGLLVCTVGLRGGR